MKRTMNAAALGLGGALIFAVAACSANDPTAESSRAGAGTPGAAVPAAPAHAPKLSVVRAPDSPAIEVVKRVSLRKASTKPLHVLSGGAAGTCGYTSGDATCDACLTGTCCTEDAACAGDADCTALVDCYGACTDDACFSSCDAAHATGAAKLDTFLQCVETSCATDCGGPPPPPPGPPGPPPGGGPGACGGTVTSGSATCDACLDASCCTDVTSCTSDADCRDFMSCTDACTDAACAASCQTAHPAGAAELDALTTCVTSSCGSSCN